LHYRCSRSFEYLSIVANLKRVRCPWDGGGVIGPSVSTFYFSATASGFSADLQTFFQAVKGWLPDDVTITVPNTGDIINEVNGELTGVWTDSGGSTSTGTQTANFALGAGARVTWVTAGIRGGRRVSGTTFLVPIASSAMDTTGRISSGATASITTAASDLVTAQSPDFMVWGKPHSKAAADGESNAVLAGFCRTVPTSLRSRRS
jgi:hypothetical protein